MMIAIAMPKPAIIAWIVVLSCAAVVSAGPGDKRVSASLIADATSIRPGDQFQVGVLLNIDPGWHIYWKNPGDSGMATRVTLDLPAGLTAGPVQYPAPHLLRLAGDILNYVYEDQVMLIVPVTADSSFSHDQRSPVDIWARVHWLVCRDVCLPGSAKVRLQLPASQNSAETKHSVDAQFEQWEAKMPRPADPANVASVEPQLDLQPAGAGSAGHIRVTIRWKQVPDSIQWFPGPAEGFDVSDPSVNTAKDKSIASVALSSPSNAPLPNEIDCVLTYTAADGKHMALDIPVRASDQRQMAQKQNSQ
jgi:thiol:disulfide interchange protein DsbD